MEARELTRETWLKEDLAALFSGGEPLWRKTSNAHVRLATDVESALYRDAAAARDDVPGELRLAYLLPIDAAS